MNLRAAEEGSMSAGTLRSARDRGRIEVFPAVVGAIAGHAAIECYGIMGMAARGLRDGVATLLRRENLHRGVEVRESEGQLSIDVYVVVQYGVRITEVAHNLKSAVRFEVERATRVAVSEVNVFVQGVHGDNGKL
ncbi:MAG TPA: Asp23/Gls24 family envelope stress response protein [Candidatus Eisenbacteria bacterium]|nr:Asp23/Gls24 family envelope stress response protein [Candidatus Eisenbacteria bacterium]